MQLLTEKEFQSLLINAGIRPSLRRSLKFGISTAGVKWDESELSKRLTDFATGRSQPIICDFCATWQPGDGAARIIFGMPDGRRAAFICCADLACSRHVREETLAAKVSRAHLRESITAERRVERLRFRLNSLFG